jgi:tripartite-type tricarboxylate transporter receptor subunit TctC
MSSSKTFDAGGRSTDPDRRTFSLRLTAAVAAMTGAFGHWSPLGAQPREYPSHPIRIVFPYAPGGGPESTLRLIAKKVEEETGATILIENRPGAGGTVGAAFVKQSPPDGYTLLQGDHATHGANVALFKNLPYDPIADFQPVTLLFFSRTFLIVPSSVNVNSVKELHELAKTKPGGLSYASPGVGSGGHIGGAMLSKAFGTPMIHVPYRGSSPTRTDVLAGRVDFVFNSLQPFIGDVEAGTVKVLAVASQQRAANAPSVPTLDELGFPGVNLQNWFGLFAPVGTDTAIVDRLNSIFSKAASSSTLIDFAAKQGFFIRSMSRVEFASFVKEQIELLGRVVRETKMQIQ